MLASNFSGNVVRSRFGHWYRVCDQVQDLRVSLDQWHLFRRSQHLGCRLPDIFVRRLTLIAEKVEMVSNGFLSISNPALYPQSISMLFTGKSALIDRDFFPSINIQYTQISSFIMTNYKYIIIRLQNFRKLPKIRGYPISGNQKLPLGQLRTTMVGPLTASQSTPTAAQKQKNDTNTAVPPSSDGVKPSSVDNAREIRRRKLVDAVNENCALEGLALFECQDSWSLWNRFTLCQAFQTQYMNCLNGQRVATFGLFSLI